MEPIASSSTKPPTSAAVALAGCSIRRPEAFHGRVEIADALPSLRSFPARITTTLGVCLKRGGPHAIEANGVAMVYPADSLCLRSPGTVWSSEAASVGFLSVDIDPEGLEGEVPPGVFRFLPDGLDLQRVVAVLETAPTRLERDVALGELIGWLWGRLCPSPGGASGPEPPWLPRACRHLEDSLAENPTLDDLARLVDQNKFSLLRQFKRAKGMTPHHYLVNLRVAKARELLTRGLCPSEVAVSVGFADQAHLNRHFLRVVGLPPGRYAREHRSVSFFERTSP